ncbi:MAG: hypothetical protein JWP89_1413 [Schlesneria sp.]|nr:hypothetical protein [Schlesneria sp.]
MHQTPTTPTEFISVEFGPLHYAGRRSSPEIDLSQNLHFFEENGQK